MNDRLQCCVIASLVVILGLSGCVGNSNDPTDVAKEIRAILPEQTGLPRKEVEELERSATVRPDDAPNQTFSWLLLFYRPRPLQAGKTPHDIVLEGASFGIDAAEILAELSRIQTGTQGEYGTFVNADRITDIRCSVKGDMAAGVFTFATPSAFSGTIEFTARRVDGKWRLDEFRLPNEGYRTTRGADGLWKMTLPDFADGTDAGARQEPLRDKVD